MSAPYASMRRRIAAMVYDFFLIIGIWMVSIAGLVQVFNEGEAISGLGLQLFLFFELFLFYIFFWSFRGQSLGMQVWKIRVVNLQGKVLSPREACMRFCWASISLMPLGLGFFWMLFKAEHIALHDKLSKTRVIYLGSKPY